MSDLPLGTLAEILAADDTVANGVVEQVPEWKLSVRLRGLTRGEVQTMTEKEGADREAFLLHKAIVEPALSEDEARSLLETKGFAATQRILNRILEVSGLTDGFRQDETG